MQTIVDKTINIVLGCIAVVIIVFVYWTCCAVAKRTDEMSEKEFEKHYGKDDADE